MNPRGGLLWLAAVQAFVQNISRSSRPASSLLVSLKKIALIAVSVAADGD